MLNHSSFEERYAASTLRDGNTGCVLWTRRLLPSGYAQIRLGSLKMSAHRAAYLHFVGPIPEGRELDHLCRVRCCVNPAHLEPVTKSVNQRRGAHVIRAWARLAMTDGRTHCHRGHSWIMDNLMFIKPCGAYPRGHVQCRICHRNAAIRFKENRRAQRAN